VHVKIFTGSRPAAIVTVADTATEADGGVHHNPERLG
jgi:hypothetical protein